MEILLLLMKKQLRKIRVSIYWIPYLFFLLYFDALHLIWIAFIMLMIHEVGHVLMGVYLQLQLHQLTIYPFGIFADYDNLDHYPSKYEFLMAISGPLFQIFNFILLNLLYQYQLLSLNQLDYYQMLNVQMAIFNILPIYPLDGGRVLRSICMHIFPYGIALKMTYVISMFIFIFVVFHVSNIWLIAFVVLYSYFIIKEFQLLLEKKLLFYYHRFTHDVFYKDKLHGFGDLYKDYHNIIIYHKKRLYERQWISRYFDKKSK